MQSKQIKFIINFIFSSYLIALEGKAFHRLFFLGFIAHVSQFGVQTIDETKTKETTLIIMLLLYPFIPFNEFPYNCASQRHPYEYINQLPLTEKNTEPDWADRSFSSSFCLLLCVAVY